MVISPTPPLILQSLTISRFRNINDAELQLGPGLNVLCGDNGAGKTSVLEAVHVLSQLRSFKTRNPAHLIRHDEEDFIVRAVLLPRGGVGGSPTRIGLRRSREQTELRIDGEAVNRPSQAADRLPVLSLHPESFSLLTGPRALRRSFLDWGVFYANPEFRSYWRKYRQALKQRNMALRGRQGARLVRCWDPVLAEAGEAISRLREDYLSKLSEQLPPLSAAFSQRLDLAVRYGSGWPSDIGLEAQLGLSFETDRARGFTQAGPHRGGFSVMFNGRPIGDSASRGQIKLATILFMLAQLQLLKESGRECVLLLDDIDSELDERTLSEFLATVAKGDTQILVTTLHPEKFSSGSFPSPAMFHVKHGRIERVG